MDMKLWRAATKELRRIETEWRICYILVGLGMVGMFTSLAFPEPLETVVLLTFVCLLILGMFASLVPMWRGTRYNPDDCRLPRIREVTADNPAVLKIVLSYLRQEVLAPKEQFVKSVRDDSEVLAKELEIFVKDQAELERGLQSAGDEQDNAIDLSALLRLNQLIPLIKQRLDSLNAQIAEAEAIVEPVVGQLAELQQHLDRLTRDVRVAASLKALDKIDRKIPVNDQFLSSLRIATDRAKEALAELVEDSKDIQAAWAEVRLESTLSPEDEVQSRN